MPDVINFQHYEVLVRDDGSPWELGRGAMGVTYKALDTNLRVPVALKVIHPRQLGSELVAQRFVREARAAARLRHPHIAAVYHLGQEEENWFYAMEFVAGDTAEALVKREGPLPEPIVLTLAIQAARALNAAAALGLVHRDIKPSNLMLTHENDEWQLKLIDFGLARTFTKDEPEEDLAALTHSGFVGTPYYASPEQFEELELDIRSDIYSLGVTLWFLLTGKVPFTGSVVSVLSQHLHKLPPFEHLDRVTSPGTRQVIQRMLEKDPAARPQTALDLRRELDHCEAEISSSRATSERPPAPPAPESPTAAEVAETMAAPTAPDATTRGPVFTPGELQFEGSEAATEFGFGQLGRARARTSGQEFAVLRLGPERALDDASLARLREIIRRAQAIDHDDVWKVHAVEADAAGLQIFLAWSAGFPWRDLLRRHRELAPAEALPLLARAARGIDAILAAGIDQPDVSLAGLWCEATSAETTPTRVRVSPLGFLRTASMAGTWGGEGTLAGPASTGSEAGARGAIRSLAQIAYETLGGVLAAPGFPPLPALSEAANKILRTALRDPEDFPSAATLIEQLAHAQAERALLPDPRRAATHVPPPPERAPAIPPPARSSSPATRKKESPLTPSPSPNASGTLAPPRPEESAAPPDSLPWTTPAHSPLRWIAIAAGLAVLGGASWLFLHPPGDSPPEPGASTIAAIPAPTTPAPPATTPKRVAIVKPPAPTPLPTPPPPPPPTRAELALELQKQAADHRARGQWKEAARVLLAMRKAFPEASAAGVDLELLFREVRWRYTRYRDQPPELKFDDVEAIRPEIEEAKSAGIVGAHLLLGEHLSTRKDWRPAIESYERVRDRAPKATTRIGLLYARFSDQPEELAKAWQYFQAAHQTGDLDGKVATAECLLYGTFRGETGDKVVPGLRADQEAGARMLREIIATAPSRREPAELGNVELPETYVSEPNRSKLVLGSFYLQQELAPEAQPDWYRKERATLNHAKELRRLLDEAKEDWTDAYALLGAAAAVGVGGKPNRATAETYFKQGAGKDNPLTMYNYARHLTEAAQGAKLSDEARKLFSRAAEKGHPGAAKFCELNKIPFKRKTAP